MTPASVGHAWLATMPETVARQRRVLGALLDAIEPDPTFRWLELAASLARGAGDGLSDIDAGVGVADDTWPGAVERTRELVESLDEVTDRFSHSMPGARGDAARHLFTLYADGTQLSLVVMPASWRRGLPPGAVALYDIDDQLVTRWEPPVLRADESTLAEWVYQGWIALADLAKYVDRGSLWEARARLEETRTQIWRLWAARQGLDYPSFGLTTVLDADPPTVPTGIEATVADLDPDRLRAAATAAARILGDVAPFRPALADWAEGRLSGRN